MPLRGGQSVEQRYVLLRTPQAARYGLFLAACHPGQQVGSAWRFVRLLMGRRWAATMPS